MFLRHRDRYEQRGDSEDEQNRVRTDTPIEPSQVRAYARELFGIELGDEPLLFETL